MKKRLLSYVLSFSLMVTMFATLGITLGVSAADGKLATALSSLSSWETNASSMASIVNNGTITFTTPTGGATLVGYKNNFVQSGETMSFDIQYSGKALSGWTALQFRTDKCGAVDFTTAANGYSAWICDNRIELSIGTSVKATLTGVTPFDGSKHTLDVTVTDLAEGVKFEILYDGVATKSWIDTAWTFTGSSKTGFAIHDFGVGTFTIADKEPPAVKENLTMALADKANWKSEGRQYVEDYTSNGKLSFNTGVNNNTVIGYNGNFVQSGQTKSFDIQYTNKDLAGWTTLQFRTNQAGVGYSSEFAGASGYTLFIADSRVGIGNGTAAYNAAGSIAYGIYLFDGNIHTVDVTITDEAAGIKIDVVIDGNTHLTYTDPAKTYGPERTGFGIHDLNGPNATGASSLVLADKGTLPREYKTLPEATADANNWAFYTGNTVSNSPATVFTNDGKISFKNAESYGTYVDANYKGNFVKDGRTMEFNIQYADRNGVGWTALMFRTKHNSYVEVTTNYVYTVWITGAEVSIAVGATPKATLYGINLMDGNIHTLAVTITDVTGGVKIDLTVDALSTTWTDTSAQALDYTFTGFCIEDYYNGATPSTLTLAGKAPQITTQPMNKEVEFGKSATFFVNTSLNNAGFRWQKSIDNGVTWTTIAGANTSAYTVDKATMEDNGTQYRVVVDGAGSAYSQAVTLTLSTPGLSKNPTVVGAQIRPNDQSIRFVLGVQESDLNALRNAGYTVEYGTILVEKTKFAGNALTVTQRKTGFGGTEPTTVKCSSSFVPAGWENAGIRVWSLALTNINTTTKQTTEIAVRAYVKVTKGSQTWEFYSNDDKTNYGAYAVSYKKVVDAYNNDPLKKEEQRDMLWIGPKSINLDPTSSGLGYVMEDFVDQLTDANNWPTLLKKTRVLKLYIQQLYTTSNTDLRRIADFVREQDLLVAVEVGSVRVASGSLAAGQIQANQLGVTAAELEYQHLKNFIDLGGRVDYISTDHALAENITGRTDEFYTALGSNLDACLQQQVNYFIYLQQRIPGLKVGVIESLGFFSVYSSLYSYQYPNNDTDHITINVGFETYFDRLLAVAAQNGVTIDHFHIDFGYSEVKFDGTRTGRTLDFGRVLAVEDYVQARGVDCGFIAANAWGDEGPNLQPSDINRENQTAYNNTITLFEEYMKAGGRSATLLFQRWQYFPAGVGSESEPYSCMGIFKAMLDSTYFPK